MKRGKRKIQEENDVLLEIGKEGTEGIKNFVEHKKSEEKEIQEQTERIIEETQKRTKNRLEYNRFLSDVLIAELDSLITPIGWKIIVGPDHKGVIMELHGPDHRIYRSAFASTGDARLDLNAVHNYALRAEQTLFRMRNDGIIV
jgi:hypothetical protein